MRKVPPVTVSTDPVFLEITQTQMTLPKGKVKYVWKARRLEIRPKKALTSAWVLHIPAKGEPTYEASRALFYVIEPPPPEAKEGDKPRKVSVRPFTFAMWYQRLALAGHMPLGPNDAVLFINSSEPTAIQARVDSLVAQAHKEANDLPSLPFKKREAAVKSIERKHAEIGRLTASRMS